PEDFVCAYPTREDLVRGTNCSEILGGLRWFGLSKRLPVVSEDRQTYEVVLPALGAADVAAAVSPTTKYGDLIDKIEALCAQMGPRCRSAVDQGMARAYMPVSDDLVPEVLMSRSQLDQLVKVLDAFATFGAMARGREGRAHLVSALLATVGSVLQIDFDDGQVPLARQLELAAGIPLGARRKLMQYSVAELGDASKVPACEIDFLAAYAAKKRDVLNIVLQSEGKLLVQFSESRWPESACPTLSEKGRNVPFIEGAVRPRSLNAASGDTKYSM